MMSYDPLISEKQVIKPLYSQTENLNCYIANFFIDYLITVTTVSYHDVMGSNQVLSLLTNIHLSSVMMEAPN